MIKATEEAEQISVVLHSSSCHVPFKDGVCNSTEYNFKSPDGIQKKPKPKRLETGFDVILKQRELSPRAAQSANYLGAVGKCDFCHFFGAPTLKNNEKSISRIIDFCLSSTFLRDFYRVQKIDQTFD
jgi:hypothetical protein